MRSTSMGIGILVILVALYAGSLFGVNQMTTRTSEGNGIVCPAWANYGAAKCDVKIWKTDNTTHEQIDMADWDKVRITLLYPKVVFTEAVNMLVTRDNGENVDISQIISPGSYIFEKADKTKPAHFNFVTVRSEVSALSGEFVRPTK